MSTSLVGKSCGGFSAPVRQPLPVYRLRLDARQMLPGCPVRALGLGDDGADGIQAQVGFLGDLAQRHGRLIERVPKLGDVDAFKPYRLTNERLYVDAAVPQLQDTPHLGGTGGERPADVARRLGVGVCLFQSRTRALNRATRALCLSIIWECSFQNGFQVQQLSAVSSISNVSHQLSVMVRLLDVLAQAVLRLA
jgi:hypothetical protein